MKPRRPLGERFREERRAAVERRVGPGVRRDPAVLDAAVGAALTETGPANAYAIAAAVRAAGTPISEVQVYRVLTRLIDRGEVDATVIGSRFMPVCPDAGSCALLICSGCGNAARMPADDCHRRLEELAAERSFRAGRTVVELLGLCAACSPSQRATAS